MKYLILVLLCFSLNLYAQNKNGDGQYFYNCKISGFDGESGEGKAVFLQRGQQQRLEIYYNINNKSSMRYTCFADLGKKTFEAIVYDTDGREVNRKNGSFEDLDKEVLRKEWAISETKEKKTIQAYNCTKWHGTWDLKYSCMPQMEVFISPKIAANAHYILKTLEPNLHVEGLPLQLNFFCLGMFNLSIEIDRIETDLPDAIWFNAKATPFYPFPELKQVEKTNPSKQLENLSLKRAKAVKDILPTYNFLLYTSVEKSLTTKTGAERQFLQNSLFALAKYKGALRDELEKALDKLKSYNRTEDAEDKVAALAVFTEQYLDQINKAFHELNQQIKTSSETLSKDFGMPEFDFYEYLPKLEYGDFKAYQGLNFKQADLLLRTYMQMAEEAEAKYLIWLWDNSGSAPLSKSKFEIFSSSKKPYILLGETFETEISLGARLENGLFSANINGQTLRMENGKATYTARPSSVGEQNYEVKIVTVDPSTGEKITDTRTFSYEVGVPSVTVAPDKMNVFYIGVDNPISVAAAGISSNDVEVLIEGEGDAEIKSDASRGRYIVRAKTGTSAGGYCNVVVRNKKLGRVMGKYPFRVKRLPDPVVRLSNNKAGGMLSPTEMQAQRGLMALLLNFDFDAKCAVESFALQKVSDGKVLPEIKCSGASFEGTSAESVKSAKAGDLFIFKDISVRCPGDATSREMSPMVFEVTK